jgi:hypothetical protein
MGKSPRWLPIGTYHHNTTQRDRTVTTRTLTTMTDPCAHPTFVADVAVGRIGEDDPGADGTPRAFIAEVRVNCNACGEPFRFVGVPAGISFDQPRVSLGELTLSAPIRPQSAPDGPSGLPGVGGVVHVDQPDPPPASTRKPGCFHPWPGCNC